VLWDSCLQVIDVSNPANPLRAGGNSSFDGQEVFVTSSHVFVAAGEAGLVVLQPGLLLPPQITVAPQDQSVSVGASVVFSVSAAGSEPLAYQWRKDGADLNDTTRISGSSTPQLTISALQLSDAGGYSVVVSNAHGSVTSSVAVLTVTNASPTSYSLLAYYYPVYAGNQWIYDGTDYDGTPCQTLVRVDAVSTPVACYTGRTTPTAYATNLTRLYSAYGSLGTGGFVPGDWWYDYMSTTPGLAMWGSDDDPGVEEIRVDGGGYWGDVVTTGQVCSDTADAYMNGSYAGEASLQLEILEQTSVTVPAGTYPDCLHLRFAYLTGEGPRVFEEWWAKGVGAVKQRGVSGNGVAQQRDLIQATVTDPGTPPALEVRRSNGFPEIRVTGVVGCRYALDYTSALADTIVWQGLVTNTLTSNPMTFVDTSVPGAAPRFYRARLVP